MKKAAFLLSLVLLLTTLPACGTVEGEASVQSVSMICGLGSVGLADRFGGIISPLGETKIQRDDSMTVDEVKVKVGDQVTVDQVLFTYDLSQVRRDLEQAQLELEQQQMQLENKQDEKEELESLLNRTYDDATRRQYSLDIREANVAILEYNASIAARKKDIQKLQTNLQNTSVKSTVAGEVQSINQDGATDNYGNPLPFMTIVETGGYRVKGYVNENNASALREGTAVVIRSRVSDDTWTGRVTSVDWNSPLQQQNYYDNDTALSSKYPFYVTLDSSDGLLMGQHVYIEPDYGQEDTSDPSAIDLPAYFLNDTDSKPWVWAQSRRGKLEKRSVTLGDYNAELDTYPVLSGLTAEDYIAFPDETLQSGMTCVTYDDATFGGDTYVDGGGTYVDDGGFDDGFVDDGGVVEEVLPAVEE